MLKEFQKIFVDPIDYSPLSFEGELRNGLWYNGYLRSSSGETWPVREGIPNFIRTEVSGARWTDERIKELLDNGTYEQNWKNGRRVLNEAGSGFAEACQETADRGCPIIDIASGPGGGFMPLLLVLNPETVVMATDAGPPVVHGWKEYFDRQGITLPVCFAAFDARNMPLASNSVEVITSSGGFSSVSEPLIAFREAARVLADDGIIYAAEAAIEREGLEVLSSKMGWDFEAKFGHRFKMTLTEIFDESGLKILKEKPYFRRRIRPDDNEYAEAACKIGIELWLGGNVYWLVKRD